MAKARTPRKKKASDDEPTQPVVAEQVAAPVKEEPRPPIPLTPEETEMLEAREKAKKEVAEREAAYNRDVLPGKMEKLKAALKKVGKKATTEEILKAAFDAMGEGQDALRW